MKISPNVCACATALWGPCLFEPQHVQVPKADAEAVHDILSGCPIDILTPEMWLVEMEEGLMFFLAFLGGKMYISDTATTVGLSPPEL